MQFQTQVATGRRKQAISRTTQLHLRLCWCWPRFSINSDAIYLVPGLLHLTEFPDSLGLEALRTNTLFLSQPLHPAPRPGLSLPLFCHPAGRLFLPTSSHHGEQWSGTQRAWPMVCICLPEEEDLQSPVLRLFGANDQWGVFKLVEPTVPT